MKRLTNTSDVVEAWADQDRPSGAHNNVSFEGPRLFSYDTPVAAILVRTVDAHAPMRICLTPFRRHSATTSGHIAQARSAVGRAGIPSLAVATIDAPLDHQRNLLSLAEAAMVEHRKALGARAHRQHRIDMRGKRVSELNLYARFFGLPVEFDPDASKPFGERMESLVAWINAAPMERLAA